MPTEPENRGLPAAPHPGSESGAGQTVVINQSQGFGSRLRMWVIVSLLIASLLANYSMYVAYSDYFSTSDGPGEKFHSGDAQASDKLALIRIAGTIMPPFSDRIIKSIKKAKEDPHVKGVLLVVDSPGGTVTDSHQIYHRLKELVEKKPIVVSMESLAASGGYFVAMGAGTKGKIFAEPTTWTGSIGVIIPHYEVTGVAEKIGFKAAPLKTGEFKDSLSPFREMTPRDQEVWSNILNQSYELFLEVIDENRDTLDREQVRALATGQIDTAQDAKQNGMIDEIGFQEDAVAALKTMTGLSKARIVSYHYPIDVWDALLGTAKAGDPAAQWRAVLELTVPRAMFYFSAGLPAAAGR
jgi:protease IV